MNKRHARSETRTFRLKLLISLSSHSDPVFPKYLVLKVRTKNSLTAVALAAEVRTFIRLLRVMTGSQRVQTAFQNKTSSSSRHKL